MTVLRLSSGVDLSVRASAQEIVTILSESVGDDFVELDSEEGVAHVRPSAVLAMLEDRAHRPAGFHTS